MALRDNVRGGRTGAVIVVMAVVFSSDEPEDEIAASSESKSEAEAAGFEPTTMLPSMLATFW